MKQRIAYVDIRTLIAHERVDRARLAVVRRQLHADGVVRRPVIVERQSRVILDGHHRVQALRELGAALAPVAYVRYGDPRIRVYLRRNVMLMKLVKQAVLEMARAGKVFPSKTTRHLIRERPTMKPVRVEELLKPI